MKKNTLCLYKSKIQNDIQRQYYEKKYFVHLLKIKKPLICRKIYFKYDQYQ